MLIKTGDSHRTVDARQSDDQSVEIAVSKLWILLVVCPWTLLCMVCETLCLDLYLEWVELESLHDLSVNCHLPNSVRASVDHRNLKKYVCNSVPKDLKLVNTMHGEKIWSVCYKNSAVHPTPTLVQHPLKRSLAPTIDAFEVCIMFA